MRTILRTQSPWVAAWLPIILCLPASEAGAGGNPALATGDRVRVASSPLRLYGQTGRVERIGTDTLSVLLDGEAVPRDVPVRALTTLDRSAGTGGQLVSGIAFGFVAGAIVGGIAGNSGAQSGGSYIDIDPAVVGAAIGAAAGLVLGGIVGALIKSERWLPVREIGDARIGARFAGNRGAEVIVTSPL